MKKISIVFSALFLVCLNSFSQSSLGTSGKTMSVAEANKLNGVAQPTINGKPYSQYKAEQDALKQQQNNKKAVLPPDIVTLNAADAKLAPTKVQSVEIRPYNGYSNPTPQKTEAVVTKTEVKETLVKPEIPVNLKGSSIDPDAKPVMPDVKTPDVTVPAQNSGNTKPEAEQKQASKENNSVPSSTVPTKKD